MSAGRPDRPAPELLAGLLAWILGWMGVQSLLDGGGLGAKPQMMVFLALAAAVYGAAWAWRRERMFQLLTSVPFAITQILFLAGAVLVGTLVPQEETAAAFQARYGPHAGALLRGAHAQDLYHSLWFGGLLSLLALSMLLVAWKRRPYDLPRLGFLLVHTAPTLILLGGLWGRFQGVRAFQELRVGEPVGAFYRVEGGRPQHEAVPLPGFLLRLERFSVDADPTAYGLYAYVEPDGRGGFESNPKVFEAREGMRAGLPLTNLRFEVERLLPHAVDAGDLRENPAAPEDPALRVLLGTGDPQPLVGTLFARGRDQRREEPKGRFAVLYRETWSSAFAASLRPRGPEAELLRMTFMGKTFDHPVKVGDTWELPAFRLKVVRYFPDFAVRRTPAGDPEPYSRSEQPNEPWLEAALEAPGGSRRVLLSARHPELTDPLNAATLPPGLTLRYLRRGEEAQGRFVVFTRADQKVRLVTKGTVVRTEPLALKRPFIVEPGLSVTPLAQLDHAEYVPDFAPPPDPQEAARWAGPVLRVKVSDPASGATESAWLDARGPDGARAHAFLNGRVALLFQPRPAEPKGFTSRISVLDLRGQVLEQHELGVNRPLRFGGAWFYQTNYNPGDPTVSGVMMVREPGLPLVYAGFLTLLVGILWMFYLKPWLKRRAKGGA